MDQWEKEGAFPAHQVFKKLGDAGLLGINKPTGNYLINNLSQSSMLNFTPILFYYMMSCMQYDNFLYFLVVKTHTLHHILYK